MPPHLRAVSDLEEMNPHTKACLPSPPPALTAGKAETDSKLSENKPFPFRNGASHTESGFVRQGEALTSDT